MPAFRRPDDAVRDGELRAARDQRLRRRDHGDHGRDEVQFLDRIPCRDDARLRRRLHAVDVQARDLREVANKQVAELSDANARELLVLGLLAIAVLWLGVHPAPFTEIMHASVNDLLKHVAVSKL